MIFCSHCFCDTEIRAIIERQNNNGNCPQCRATNVSLYNTDIDSVLTPFFENLFNIYTPVTMLPADYPRAEVKMLRDELQTNWNIFNNLDARQVYAIITSVCPDLYHESPELFDGPIGITELFEPKYIKEHSVLKTNCWENFVSELINVNRFHTNHINLELFDKICSYARKKYKKGTVFYRGRIASCEGYKLDEMSAPPPGKSSAGRANSQGIRCLYLANDVETTIHEVRAGAFDYVAVGKFELLKDIIIVNLNNIDKISPFIEALDSVEYAINKEHLKKMNREMGKALRRSDSVLDYVPTQYVSDFIKSIRFEDEYGKYAGIEYNSTMKEKGFNLAIFYPELFACIGVDTYRVDSLEYATSKM